MKRWIRLAAMSGAVAIAACTDTSVAPTAPEASRAAGTQSSPSIVHVMPTRALYAAADESGVLRGRSRGGKGGGGGGGGTGIFYHGGPLLLTPSVAAIYWSSGTIYAGGPAAGTFGAGSSDNSLTGYFMGSLGASSYWNINTTYFDGSSQHVQRSLTFSQYWAANVNVPAPGASVSDAQIQAIITTGFTSGKLTYDANTIYAVFSDAGVNLGGGFGSQYCAYHGHFTWNGNDVKFAAMPHNIDYPSGCTDGQAPNGDAAADAEVNTLAHELEEATTDPDLNAWYDRRGYENADKCAWNFGTVSGPSGAQYNITVGAKHFMVQQNWINSGSGGCRQGL
jgi:hypothetical protein